MNLEKGCPYCANLKRIKQPQLGFDRFECRVFPSLKIENAGACFVSELDNGLIVPIENCPGFTPEGKEEPK